MKIKISTDDIYVAVTLHDGKSTENNEDLPDIEIYRKKQQRAIPISLEEVAGAIPETPDLYSLSRTHKRNKQVTADELLARHILEDRKEY